MSIFDLFDPGGTCDSGFAETSPSGWVLRSPCDLDDGHVGRHVNRRRDIEWDNNPAREKFLADIAEFYAWLHEQNDELTGPRT